MITAPPSTSHDRSGRGARQPVRRPRSAGRRSRRCRDDTRLAVEIRDAASSAATLDEARERFAELVVAPPAPRAAHRVSVSARRRRRRRSRAGRVRQGLQPHQLVSRGVAVRGLVHAHSHQRLPRSAEGARAARPLVRRRPRSRSASTRRGRPSAAGRRLDPEARLLARERRARLAAAIDRLDGRQRTVFMLCHYGDCTPREVSAMTGLNESTVRVHLFRAARKLRGLLGGKP